MKACLIAVVYLYPAEQGGRNRPIKDGYRCPCFAQKDTKLGGWDCMVEVGEQPLQPGESRRSCLVFLSGKKAADIMKAAGKFYLWEGRFIGEAVALGPPNSD